MTNLLKIENDYSVFQSENAEVKKFIWERLRHRDRNYFHNRRYKMKLWDGFVDFFKQDTGKFLTGLLPEVRAVLGHFGVPYEVQDLRETLNFAHSGVDADFLNRWLPERWGNGDKAEPVTLHDYQVDFINSVSRHKRGIIFSPTASGKSYIFVGILKALPPGTPTLVLQNRVALAQQNYDEVCNWGFPNVGGLWGGFNKPDVITVASVQSIAKIEKLLPKFKVLVVDEIHDMMSALPKAVYRRMKAASVRVALSATPFKFGEKDPVQKYYVKGFFGPVLKTRATASGILTTSELQSRGVLSRSRCVFYPIREPEIPHDIYIDAVTRGVAESYHFHQVVTRLARMQAGRTLILVDRVAHGDALHSLMPDSLWVQGKDNAKTRKSVIRQLQNGSGNVVAIATQQIFNTGVNVKCHNLINAAGGQAEHQIIQRMGRGLRLADDKDGLNYIDFVFHINPYLLDHSNKRVKILTKQGHSVEIRPDLADLGLNTA